MSRTCSTLREMLNAYRMLVVGKSGRKRPLGRPKLRSEDNLNLGLVHPVAPVFNEITSQLPLFVTYRVFTVHNIIPMVLLYCIVLYCIVRNLSCLYCTQYNTIDN
jgi:hypothetical protein